MRLLKQKSLGFTLIELMIVVAIVAILTAIAYPSYQDSVRNARRGDAQALLVELANFMERTYTDNNAYNPGGLALPFTVSPKTGTTFYNLGFSAGPTANSFTLQAVPVAGSPQAGDFCGTLTLSNTGLKGSAANCW